MFTYQNVKSSILGILLLACISITAQSNGIFHGGISDGFAMGCAGSTSVIAMPVSLVSFDGTCSGKSIQLNWRTASEINSSHFILERSFCGTRWEFVSKINSSGNAAHLSRYSFNDKLQVTNRNIYYRLKQVDNDGNFEYFKILNVRNCQEQASAFNMYPSPSKGILHFSFNGDINQLQSIEICNSLGEKIYSTFNFQTEIDLSKYENGIYFYYIKTDSDIISGKIVLDK